MNTETAHIPRTFTGWFIPLGESDESAKGQVIGNAILAALSHSMRAANKLQLQYGIEADRGALEVQMERALSDAILTVFDRFGFIKKACCTEMVCPRCYKRDFEQCNPDSLCPLSRKIDPAIGAPYSN